MGRIFCGPKPQKTGLSAPIFFAPPGAKKDFRFYPLRGGW
jgi:hypothetical protein